MSIDPKTLKKIRKSDPTLFHALSIASRMQKAPTSLIGADPRKLFAFLHLLSDALVKTFEGAYPEDDHDTTHTR